MRQQARVDAWTTADTFRPELELDEEGTRISLTIVDTPGFGDQIDNEARYLKARSKSMLLCS